MTPLVILQAGAAPIAGALAGLRDHLDPFLVGRSGATGSWVGTAAMGTRHAILLRRRTRRGGPKAGGARPTDAVADA
jgi:hypothetical protein